MRSFLAASLFSALVLLSGCSSKPELKETPEQLAKLPVATQVATVLYTPILCLSMAALFWALDGRSLLSFGSHKKDK